VTMLADKKGLSLIELLLIITVIAGVFALAMPIGKKVFATNEVDARVNTIINAIRFSKNQAELMNKTLILGVITDDNWTLGMRLFIDHNDDHIFGDNDKLIRQWQFSGASPIISWKGFVSDHYIIFNRDITKATISGRFVVKQGNKEKWVVMNHLGKIRIESH
jgi:Tfp pilus assembly protein FimT